MTRMLRAIALVLAIALTPLLTACPQPKAVHSKPAETPAQVVTYAINEAQVAIAAAYTTITNAQASRLITWDEFIALRDEVDKADEAYRRALELQQAGDLIKAKSRAELAKALLGVVETQLAAARNRK